MNFLKIIFFSLVLSMVSLGAIAQQEQQVSWYATAGKGVAAGEYVISLTGTIAPGWHMYAKNAEMELPGLLVKPRAATTVVNGIEFISKSATQSDVIFEIPMMVFRDNIEIKVNIKAAVADMVKLKLQYDVAKADNFLPEETSVNVSLTGNETAPIVEKNAASKILIPSIDIKNPRTNCGADSSTATGDTASKGLLSIFILGFLGGLVALLTPCVFPMIPLTVSFFTKKATTKSSGVKNAFLYGFFIFFIYVLLSVPFHFLTSLNAEIFNNISTNVTLNLIFFVVFIAFALSFFGLYEITLPSRFGNSADSKAGSGNIIGIFFMALTLAIVSFSCTGPILGSLLAGSLSADGGAWQLTAGMGGFGLALALPFGLFALFPNLLSALPKSGGWLTSVKIVLGFLELGLAFKFLSNADLVKHWGLLKREVFIGIWVIISFLTALYLIGVIKFKHDSPMKKKSPLRIALALLFAAFGIYLLPGLTNTKYAQLSLISGFPPPLYYSIYNDGKGNDCVLNLTCTRDYEEGLKMAKAQGKPILLDFTGYACVNCRRMEENVWTKPEVYEMMKENYIIVSLYVDDRKELPVGEQFTYITKDGVEKEIRTVGDKWATFETENFTNNAQPWYAIINTKEELLTHPLGYASTKKLEKEYLQWLSCGVDAFRESEQ